MFLINYLKLREEYTFNKFIFGGLLSKDEDSVSLRILQINEGIRIHTCNNYGESLEIIKLASKGIEKKLKILTKIYYRYPNSNHVRFRPLIDQLDEIVYRLGFVPSDWSIQICCYCNLKNLKSHKALNFFCKINKKYKIKKVYLEYYPVYKYKLKDISILNNYYKQKEISFGLIGYQNLLNRVFSEKDIKFLSSKSITICFLGFLGKGKQNKEFSNYVLEGKNKIDIIQANICYFLYLQKKYRSIEALTQTSTIKHHNNLKKRILEAKDYIEGDKFNNFLKKEKSLNKYYFKDYDQYGGYITTKQYIKKPKLIFSRIKYFFNSIIISLKFNNNFWG